MDAHEFDSILLRDGESPLDLFGDLERLPSFEGVLGPEQLAEWESRLKHGTRLLREFGDWVERYGFETADRAAERVFGYPFDVGAVLSFGEVPLESRLEFVRAAKEPFLCMRVRFPNLDFSTNLFMLWDHVCERFTDLITQYAPCSNHEDGRRTILHLTGEERAIHDLILEVLAELLTHPDEWVQDSALHGLGHSRHPKAGGAVQAYIDAYPEGLRGDALHWCEQCRDGSVM